MEKPKPPRVWAENTPESDIARSIIYLASVLLYIDGRERENG